MPTVTTEEQIKILQSLLRAKDYQVDSLQVSLRNSKEFNENNLNRLKKVCEVANLDYDTVLRVL